MIIACLEESESNKLVVIDYAVSCLHGMDEVDRIFRYALPQPSHNAVRSSLECSEYERLEFVDEKFHRWKTSHGVFLSNVTIETGVDFRQSHCGLLFGQDACCLSVLRR